MHPSGKPHPMVFFVENKAAEDVTRKHVLRHSTQLVRKLIVFIHPHFRSKSFHAPGPQVKAGALFLLGLSVNHVPVKSVFVCHWLIAPSGEFFSVPEKLKFEQSCRTLNRLACCDSKFAIGGECKPLEPLN